MYTNKKIMIRKDIQALRAIAVIAVLIYHFWPYRLTGGYVGVDVFFVISGFLITLHLLKKPPVSWKTLADFWARRIRRLLPAATLVLSATVISALLWLPETMVMRVLHEVVAAAVYGQNWVLAATATDYLAATEAASPVQHYWSLSIEEQFYVVWPLIIGGVFLLGRRFLTVNKLLTAAMAIIFLSSLAYSIYLTNANPAAAYFVTPTRVWELALGGMVALMATKLIVPARFAVPMAWSGLIMIATAAMLFTQQTPFPGYTALLPTLGTAFIIMAATDEMKWSPRRLFGLKPVQFIGDISYSVYLWHWPILIIAPFAFGIAKLPTILSISLILNVIVLAYLTKVYIEDPVRRSKSIMGTNLKAYAYGIASIVVVIGLTFAASGHPKVQASQRNEALKLALESDPCVGAGVLRDVECKEKYKDEILSSIAYAKSDKSVLYKDDCWSLPPSYAKDIVCSYGDRDSETKVALFGNSHAGMWHAALEKVAKDNRWRLDTYLVSSCYTMDSLQALTEYGADAPKNCREWNKWALQKIISSNYDVVVMSSRTGNSLMDVKESDMKQALIDGYTETIDQLTDAAIKVFVLRDAPTGKDLLSVPDCLAANNRSIEMCAGKPDKELTDDPLYMAAHAYKSSRVQTLDLSHRFCDATICYPAIGGVVMYFDNHHLTNSYVRTLTPDIAPPLIKFVNGK